MKLRTIFCILLIVFTAIPVSGQIPSGTVTFNIRPNILKDSKEAKLWIPYPLSDEYQTISNIRFNGNYNASAVYRDPDSGIATQSGIMLKSSLS